MNWVVVQYSLILQRQIVNIMNITQATDFGQRLLFFSPVIKYINQYSILQKWFSITSVLSRKICCWEGSFFFFSLCSYMEFKICSSVTAIYSFKKRQKTTKKTHKKKKVKMPLLVLLGCVFQMCVWNSLAFSIYMHNPNYSMVNQWVCE